jgi:DNA-directed RNA polymerase specialized sigma24 family protein
MEERTLVSTYQETVRPLYAYVSLRCGADRSLAEDVTQETWLRAVVAWKKSGLPDAPLAWLKTVAKNLLANHYRRTPMISLDALPHDWEERALGNGADKESSDHAAAVTWGLARLRPAHAHLIEAGIRDDPLRERVEAGLIPLPDRRQARSEFIRLQLEVQLLHRKLAILGEGGLPPEMS